MIASWNWSRYGQPSRTGMGLLTFLPQFASILTIGFRFYKDLPGCLLLQTMAFVAFNKVLTAQYLVWYLALLPLVLPANRMSKRNMAFLALLWLITHVHWIYWAGKLENEGFNTFRELWVAGILYFVSNIAQILQIMRNQNWTALVSRGTLQQYRKASDGCYSC